MGTGSTMFLNETCTNWEETQNGQKETKIPIQIQTDRDGLSLVMSKS